MGHLVIRQQADGTTVKEWQAEPVRDADGKIVWADERNSIPEMDTAPAGMLD